jgi:hypothetical protein
MKTKDDIRVWIVGSEFSAERLRLEAFVLRRCRHRGWHNRVVSQNGVICKFVGGGEIAVRFHVSETICNPRFQASRKLVQLQNEYRPL